jgi:hypothetical protein
MFWFNNTKGNLHCFAAILYTIEQQEIRQLEKEELLYYVEALRLNGP